MKLESIIIEPTHPPKACVIWLHGLGADGHDFVPIIPQLALPAELGIRFIFPHAPVRPVTMNMGYAMPAWFDLYGLDRQSRYDEVGIHQSAAWISEIIQAQIEQGIPANKIALVGFSQGGAVALQTALTSSVHLAGVIGLSTFLPTLESLSIPLDRQNLPVMIAHGKDDEIVEFHFGQLLCEILQKKGLTPKWHAYSMGHHVCNEEIQDISHWFRKNLA